MQMRKFLTAAAAATALFLTGCQTALEPAAISGSPEYWQQMQQKLAQVQTYNLSGRLGVSGETRFSANFNLQGTGDTYTLVLTSSLGSELAKLTVKPGEAVLLSDGKVYQAQTPDHLFKDAFALDLPGSALKQLFLGQAGQASILRPDGQLMSTAQGGFIADYQSFAEFNGYALPTDIRISKDRLFIKIKVNEVSAIE